MRGLLQMAARSARLARILDGGETLRLQYPREDLGFTYAGSGAAVCPDDPAAAAPGSSTQIGRDSDKVAPAGDRAAPYMPSTAPGARLPHAAVVLHSPGARPPQPLKHAAQVVTDSGPAMFSRVTVGSRFRSPFGLEATMGICKRLATLRD